MKALSWILTRRMPRRRCSIAPSGVIFLLFCLISSTVEARVYIQIDQPSEKKFPIAIADLTNAGGGHSHDWEQKVSAKIGNDLNLTGLFEVIDQSQYPKAAEANATNPSLNQASLIKFAPWSLIGAQALVNGSYRTEGSAVSVELHLYDPFLGQQLIGKTYRAGPKDMAVVAHHFANQIMKELTGEEGVFNTKIAFTAITGKRNKEIGVMDMDGDNAGTITRNKSINLSPTWGPGGVIYSCYGKSGNPEICMAGRKISSNGSINVSPAYGSGGLAVASAISGDTEIYLMSLGGRIINQLTRSYGIDVNPSWCPDGSFVFASERAGKLHIFRSTGERLTFVGYQNDNPACSPKGDKILFQGRDSGTWDIFIMNSDGSNIQRLTAGQGSNESPTWAPNAFFIGFSSTRSKGAQIYLMRDDGSNQVALPYKGALQPAWGPRVE